MKRIEERTNIQNRKDKVYIYTCVYVIILIRSTSSSYNAAQMMMMMMMMMTI